MKWMNSIVLGLFIVACVLSIYQSRREQWPINRKVGNVLFLFGVAVALFLDDLITSSSTFNSGAELIGVVIILVGVLLKWSWQPN